MGSRRIAYFYYRQQRNLLRLHAYAYIGFDMNVSIILFIFVMKWSPPPLLIIIVATCNKQTNTYTCTTVLVVPCVHAHRTLSIDISIFARSVHTQTQSPLFIICLFSHRMCKTNCVVTFLIGQYNGDGNKYTNTQASGGDDENFVWLTKTKRCRI